MNELIESFSKQIALEEGFVGMSNVTIYCDKGITSNTFLPNRKEELVSTRQIRSEEFRFNAYCGFPENSVLV